MRRDYFISDPELGEGELKRFMVFAFVVDFTAMLVLALRLAMFLVEDLGLHPDIFFYVLLGLWGLVLIFTWRVLRLWRRAVNLPAQRRRAVRAFAFSMVVSVWSILLLCVYIVPVLKWLGAEGYL